MRRESNGRGGAVALLVTGLGVGGAERVVLELALKLTHEGWRVVVISLNGDRALLSQYDNLPYSVYSLNTSARNLPSVWSSFLRLRAILRAEDVKIIHAHMYHALIAAVMMRSFALPKKLVFTSHNFSGFGFIRRNIIRLTRRVRSADVVFSSLQHPSLNAKNTWTIANGVSDDGEERCRLKNSKEKRPRIFLSLGRLEPQKDPLSLVSAFALTERTDCELWFAGEGPLRGALEEKILELNLQNRVKLLGRQNDVSGLFRRIDYFVMSSAWEGLPMALLEAGAHGVPVISTPVGAIPEVLSDGCGFLAKTEELSRLMNFFLEHPDAAEKSGLLLRKRVRERYSIQAMSLMHGRLYSSLLR